MIFAYACFPVPPPLVCDLIGCLVPDRHRGVSHRCHGWRGQSLGLQLSRGRLPVRGGLRLWRTLAVLPRHLLRDEGICVVSHPLPLLLLFNLTTAFPTGSGLTLRSGCIRLQCPRPRCTRWPQLPPVRIARAKVVDSGKVLPASDASLLHDFIVLLCPPARREPSRATGRRPDRFAIASAVRPPRARLCGRLVANEPVRRLVKQALDACACAWTQHVGIGLSTWWLDWVSTEEGGVWLFLCLTPPPPFTQRLLNLISALV